MLADLLNETYAGDLEEVLQRERTATLTRRGASRSHTRTQRVLGTPVRAFAVRLHQTGCSVRETATILAELGVERSHGAVWNWVHRLADSGRDPPTFGRAELSRSPSEPRGF